MTIDSQAQLKAPPMVDEYSFCHTLKESTGLDALTIGSVVDWCGREARRSGMPFERIYERRWNERGEGIGPRMEISMAAADIVLQVALAMAEARQTAFRAALGTSQTATEAYS